MECGPLTQAVLHAHVSILVYSDLCVVSQATWSYMHIVSLMHSGLIPSFSYGRVETKLCIDTPGVGSVDDIFWMYFQFRDIVIIN